MNKTFKDGDVGAPRAPLWSRNMEGLKHIRGILYDEEQIIEVRFTIRQLNI